MDLGNVNTDNTITRFLLGGADNLSLQSVNISVLNVLFQHKVLVALILLILLVCWRFLKANVLYVRRHDKADWITFGVLVGLSAISIFIKVIDRWAVVVAAVIVYSLLSLIISDKTRQVRSTIYSGSIVYEDNSDKNERGKGGDSELNEARKRREMRISRTWSPSRMSIKMGMPIFSIKFSFRQSTTATEEQLAQCLSKLSKYYTEYDWYKQRSKSGVKYEFLAVLKVNKIRSIGFDKSISDELPWYVVPVGAIDASSKQTAKDTVMVWQIQDARKEGKAFDLLKRTTLLSPSPHAFVVGQTGGGKSSLVNTMLGHWINKAKDSRETVLYLADAKKVEFTPYESLEEVADVVTTLDDAVDLTNHFCDLMMERQELMAKEGIKDIPLDGHVKLNKYININGHFFYGNTVLEYRDLDGNIKKDYALNLDGRTDISEINIPDNTEEDTNDNSDNDFGW